MEILAVFSTGEGDRHEIYRYPNGKYYICYGLPRCPCHFGPMNTFAQALDELHLRRPLAVRLNDMCGGCTQKKCPGSTCMVWTGCARKTTAAR